MTLPIDKTLTFYLRYNKSIHAGLPSNYTVWLRRGKQWENRGDADTEQLAQDKAIKIATRGKRSFQFVNANF